MNTARFDMAESCREALRVFADSDIPAAQEVVAQRWAELKKSATSAMTARDRTKEEERADYGALLLFLCAIDDFEKHQRSQSPDERSRLFMHASRKLHSARLQYERVEL